MAYHYVSQSSRMPWRETALRSPLDESLWHRLNVKSIIASVHPCIHPFIYGIIDSFPRFFWASTKVYLTSQILLAQSVWTGFRFWGLHRLVRRKMCGYRSMGVILVATQLWDLGRSIQPLSLSLLIWIMATIISIGTYPWGWQEARTR